MKLVLRWLLPRFRECTEAVFQALNGVNSVEPGFVKGVGDSTFYEAVLVNYSPKTISLARLIEVHLAAHKSRSNSSWRDKFRYAIYTFCQEQAEKAQLFLNRCKAEDPKIVNQVLAFKTFQASRKLIQNYYRRNPQKPFCVKYIDPKLKVLQPIFI